MSEAINKILHDLSNKVSVIQSKAKRIKLLNKDTEIDADIDKLTVAVAESIQMLRQLKLEFDQSQLK